MTDDEQEVVDSMNRTTDRFLYFGGGVLVLIILSMTTCTMHSNTFDPERLREEAGIVRAEMELEKFKAETNRQESEMFKERLKTIERMVASGVNPIAAACAVTSFEKDNMGCIVSAAKGNTRMVNQEE